MFYVFSLLIPVSLTTLIHNTEAETQVDYSAVKFLQRSKITEWHGLNIYY